MADLRDLTLVRMGNCLRKILHEVMVSADCDSQSTVQPAPRRFGSPFAALEVCVRCIFMTWWVNVGNSASVLLLSVTLRARPTCVSSSTLSCCIAKTLTQVALLLSYEARTLNGESVWPQRRKRMRIVAEPTNHHHRCQSDRLPNPRRILLQ
jgi:hypothetical protein